MAYTVIRGHYFGKPMFDILFICRHCGLHLSADENDVGATFPCPECANSLVIPTGDILFECPECGKSLLAGRTAARQRFHCPNCDRVILIPPIGKTVPVSERTESISPPPVAEPPIVPQNAQPNPVVSEVPAEAADRQFMSTWGDYLAEAGLADNQASSPQKREPE